MHYAPYIISDSSSTTVTVIHDHYLSLYFIHHISMFKFLFCTLLERLSLMIKKCNGIFDQLTGWRGHQQAVPYVQYSLPLHTKILQAIQ